MKKNKERTKDSIVLTQEEISNIKNFVDIIKQFPSVDCIYVFPEYVYDIDQLCVYVYVLYRNGLELEEENDINETTQNYNDWERILYYDSSDYDYSFPPEYISEIKALVRLYYGTIIYDRSGDKTKMKEELLTGNHLPEWSLTRWEDSIIPIENIDELMNSLDNDLSLNRKITDK